MILFQTDYDMTTVEVELRKFKPIEECHKLMHQIVLGAVISLSVLTMAAAEVWQYMFIKKHENNSNYTKVVECVHIKSFKMDRLLSVVQMTLVFLFFVKTTLQFFCAARKYQNVEYTEHRRRYWIQASGIATVCLINLTGSALYFHADHSCSEEIGPKPSNAYANTNYLI
jgi:hypothetical protein